MSDLNPNKLHTKWMRDEDRLNLSFPRCYTLTHSDRTGDLFLTIGPSFDEDQISGWYTRLMRDEVVAKWEELEGSPVLRVHCHVSGGLIIGSARWRYSIFQRHLKQVLQAFRHGDRELFERRSDLDTARVEVYFHSSNPDFDRVENWGSAGEYR